MFEIEHALQLLELHVEQHADAAGQRLQEPDVGNRRGQFDMAHALAADLRHGHFHAALFADDALVLHALVLAAQALVILDRAKDAGAEQAITFRLEGPVVDGFWLLDLAERPAADLFRAGDGNLDLVKRLGLGGRREEIHHFVRHLLSSVSPPARGKGWGWAECGVGKTGGEAGYSTSSLLCSWTLRPSDRISLTSTLKLSGIPASNVSSPLTMASYTLVRPTTSSDLTVSISCKV